MLTYNMNKNVDTSLYLQLYGFIKEDIEKGKIASNEKLPSKRALAEHLMLSVITVQNAYAQLQAEGYIYSSEREGYFASEISTVKSELTLPYKTHTHIKEKLSPENEHYFSVDLSESSTNIASFPFSLWSKLTRKIMQNNQSALISKIPAFGLWELRLAISEYLYRFRGMNVDPNCILIGAGTDYLYGILAKLFGKDRVYAIENPGYSKILQVYQSEGLDVKLINLDNYGLSSQMLYESGANIVHLSPSHNFPTGIVMPIARRMEILEWAQVSPERYIIEDDYDSEFRFASKPLPTLQSRDISNNTIYINTFSKTISPSLRISYMILPPTLAKRYNENFAFLSCPVCGFDQHILASFIHEGYFERHINRMRKFYKQHRDEILQTITTSSIGEYSEIREELSGLHFILKLRTNKNLGTIKKLCAEYGLKISFLADYYHNDEAKKNMQLQPNKTKSTEHYVELIINYSGVEISAMQKAIKILTKII